MTNLLDTDYNAIKFEINNKKKFKTMLTTTYAWKLVKQSSE